MRKSLALISLLFGVCCLSALADDGDDLRAEAMKSHPPVSGGYAFKMYGTPEQLGQEILVDEGVFYISPELFTDAQMAEANDKKYAPVHLDELSVYAKSFNICIAMVQHQRQSTDTPPTQTMMNWLGNKGYLTIYSWADWWEKWHITAAKGNIAVEDSGSEQGWGLKNERIVAEADPKVNLENCLGYVKEHGA